MHCRIDRDVVDFASLNSGYMPRSMAAMAAAVTAAVASTMAVTTVAAAAAGIDSADAVSITITTPGVV
jgi:hypothetical protein